MTFELTAQQLKRYQRAPKENAVLHDSLKFLQLHPAVQWARRMNAGAMRKQYRNKRGRVREHFVRFGFPGMSDILGQMRDGRILALETKRKGCKPTDDQQMFIDQVRKGHGVAGVVYSLDDTIELIAQAGDRRKDDRLDR